MEKFDDINLILDKKLLETITENQNSPNSTQASHNTSRRVSAQSIFGGIALRGSVQKEPFIGPVMELYHENETETNKERKREKKVREKERERYTQLLKL